jgi:type VI secretion system protein ImpC
MAKSWSMKVGDIRLASGPSEAPARPADDAPFRILLLGDFSGRPALDVPLTGRRPVPIDRDNFEEVLPKLDVRVCLPAGQVGPEPLTIPFRELDDFHPDRLYEQLEVFDALRDLRARLGNPRTFDSAAAEVRSWAGSRAAAGNEAKSPPSSSDAADLIEELLSGASHPGSAQEGAASDWNAFLRQLVAPHLVPGADADQDELIARVDQASAAQMRALLHHPEFQAREAAWRAVHLLVRRLDTDEGLKLFLLDLSRAELSSDLAGADDLRGSHLYRLLVEEAISTPGGQPWAVLAGDYTFGPSSQDALLLARLGLVAQAAGAPFLAAADSRLFGCSSLAKTPDPHDWDLSASDEESEVWAAVRATPQAGYLGLTAPRWLVRFPYGADAASTEQFPFEELPQGAAHAGYLWGNPAFACALLLGQAFNQASWGLRPGMVSEIDNLPAHVYQEDGEGRLKPCAEVVLSERACDRILAAGVMPLLSLAGRDKVRLARFQSLAAPSTPLAGRWH